MHDISKTAHHRWSLLLTYHATNTCCNCFCGQYVSANRLTISMRPVGRKSTAGSVRVCILFPDTVVASHWNSHFRYANARLCLIRWVNDVFQLVSCLVGSCRSDVHVKLAPPHFACDIPVSSPHLTGAFPSPPPLPGPFHPSPPAPFPSGDNVPNVSTNSWV